MAKNIFQNLDSLNTFICKNIDYFTIITFHSFHRSSAVYSVKILNFILIHIKSPITVNNNWTTVSISTRFIYIFYRILLLLRTLKHPVQIGLKSCQFFFSASCSYQPIFLHFLIKKIKCLDVKNIF